MYTQRITGSPSLCCNRLCRAPFTRESHLGYLQKSETEVFAVMRCQKCGDTFKIIQMISKANAYKQALKPGKQNPSAPSQKITLSEIDTIRKQMDDDNPLKTLFEGQKPGAPNKVGEEE